MSATEQITRARRAGAQAIKRAAEERTKRGASRSTATRASYKAKAEGLDKVLEILGTAKPAARKRPARKR